MTLSQPLWVSSTLSILCLDRHPSPIEISRPKPNNGNPCRAPSRAGNGAALAPFRALCSNSAPPQPKHMKRDVPSRSPIPLPDTRALLKGAKTKKRGRTANRNEASRQRSLLHGQDLDKTQDHKTTVKQRLAVGGGWWLVAVGGWRWAVGGGWRWLEVGGWWLVAVTGWQLAVKGGGRWAVGGSRGCP